ncbi:MAG TPA: glucose-6-phosphate isomerase [Stellaceae bacterium]|jgi:glucose-6-phosphate isomerase|nr:glucose-6-phosphate isomerase [Stellaceae bacterium]
MDYRQNINGCLAETVGARGLDRESLDQMLARTAPALQKLRALRDDGSLPLLRLPQRKDDIAQLRRVLKTFRAAPRQRFRDVIILGTGGSSLGGQTLYDLADQRAQPRIHFMDNIDPATFDALFAALDPARTGVVAISKSGSTAETMTQFAICVAWLRQKLDADAVGRHTIAITEPKDSPLRLLAMRLKTPILDHDPGIGGRYSVLSNVGLLPAMLAGLDVAALREGAGEALEAALDAGAPNESAPALGAAIAVGLAEKHGIDITVVMPYLDRLAHFGLWFRQLWAESLGKDGKGTTPIRAMGTVDQHSQLQLYLAGPADKMFTLVTGEVAGTGPVAPPDLVSDPSLAYLVGKRMGDLLDAEQRGTEQSLIRNGRPTRRFHLARLDEKTLGGLLMHFMLETIIVADLIGVNAFDQPAVEEGKVIARQYLGEMGRQAAQ